MTAGWNPSSPGVSDRGGNDHYAVRGTLAWQPSDAHRRQPDPALPESGPARRQAGLYSHEPACPNAQSQGEFTPATSPASSGARAPGEAGTGFRDDAIIPSRGGDPWATAETEPSYVDREIFGATCASIPRFRRVRLRVDHRLPDVRQVLHRGRRCLAGRGRGLLPGQRPRPVLAGIPPVGSIRARTRSSAACTAWTSTATTPASSPIRSTATSRMSRSRRRRPRTPYSSQNEWSFNDRLEADRRPALLARQARRRVLRATRRRCRACRAPVTIIFNQDEIFADRRPDRVLVTPGDAESTFDDVTARLELDYRAERRRAAVSRATTAAARAAASRSQPARLSTRRGIRRSHFLNGIPFDPETLNAFEVGMKSNLAGSTHVERQRLLLRLRGLPGFRRSSASPDRDQPGCDGAGSRRWS